MFEAAELGRKISREDYHEQVPTLRQELLQLQQSLREADFPVVIVFAGVDGAGKSETVNLLNDWMDPRWLATRAYGEPSQEEAERPEFWRYWRDLPPAGLIGFSLSSWYSSPILDHVYNKLDTPAFDERLERIAAFEKALVDDGALVIKFWMHLSKPEQKKRLKSLEKDPLLSWRVTERDWNHWRMYEQFVAAAERAIMKTSTGRAPWHIVEGVDHRYRSLAVGTIVRDSLRKHLAQRKATEAVAEQLRQQLDNGSPALPTDEPVADSQGTGDQHHLLPTVLSTLAMDQRLSKSEYKDARKTYQGKLGLLQREAKAAGISTLVVFEGWDAAGKGGAIRRCTAALDARDYQVIPFAAPSDEERAHHYLWRFWRNLGRAGRMTFYDRSWYGRVLVERVEGFATEREWMRAYAEINDFEEQLVEHGIVLVKFWVHITQEEQLERFEARGATPWKQWKITDEDWRNREQWDEYEKAVNDMISRTSTRHAPWTLVEGNDKLYARVKVLKTLCATLESALEQRR